MPTPLRFEEYHYFYKMKIKSFILTLTLGALCFLQSSFQYQEGPSLEIANNKVNVLTLNELELTSKTTTDDFVNELGEPSRKVPYPSGEVSYFYDELGIVFFTYENEISNLGINFNWDEDEKFPETSYTGTLSIGNKDINKESTAGHIEDIEGVEFICPIPIMCASKDRKAKVKCAVAFDEGQITQVVFILE